MTLGTLLQKMQAERIHMSLVIDEYGGVEGLLTIEDLLEQIVGEINDEHELKEDLLWSKEKENVFIVNARLNLEDFKTQLSQLESMGGMDNILDKMPMHLRSKIPVDKMNFVDNSRFKKMKVIIDSMTKEEKQFPSIIKSSRKKRIANGSGTEVQDINQLLKMFVQMQSGMKKFKNKKGRNSISSMLDNFRS